MQNIEYLSDFEKAMYQKPSPIKTEYTKKEENDYRQISFGSLSQQKQALSAQTDVHFLHTEKLQSTDF